MRNLPGVEVLSIEGQQRTALKGEDVPMEVDGLGDSVRLAATSEVRRTVLQIPKGFHIEGLGLKVLSMVACAGEAGILQSNIVKNGDIIKGLLVKIRR